MRAAAEASHHAHRSPLQGLFDSIDHIFNDRNLSYAKPDEKDLYAQMFNETPL